MSLNDTIRVSRFNLDLALPICTILFLFSGLYKGLVTSPIDLTVLACVALCFLLIQMRGTLIADGTATLVLLSLMTYLAVRLFPSPTTWGVRKLVELSLFGIPAYLTGLIIAQRHEMRRILQDVLSMSAVPFGVGMVFMSAVSTPYEFHWVGSGGYQITGIYMAAAVIASAFNGRYICFAFAVLGLAVTGCVTAAAVVFPIVLFIWGYRRKAIWHHVGVTLLLLSLYTAFVAPPLVVMRALWKVGAVEANVTYGEQAPKYGGAFFTQKLLDAMPLPSQEYQIEPGKSDRGDIMKSAIKQFLTAPVFGHGYGKLTYGDDYTYPHNAMLEMLAEGGMVAGGLLVAVLILAWPRLKVDDDLYAVAMLMLVIGAALITGYFGTRVFMFFLGFAMGRKVSA